MLAAQIQARLALTIRTKEFCNQVVKNVRVSNVTVLQNDTQVAAIYAICGVGTGFGPVAYRTMFLASQRYPSIEPTSQPTNKQTPIPIQRRSLVSVVFICIIFFIILIACLRCCLILSVFCLVKKVTKSHLYDIIVILNDNEEAIFENVLHEDVVFYRRYVKILHFVFSYYFPFFSIISHFCSSSLFFINFFFCFIPFFLSLTFLPVLFIFAAFLSPVIKFCVYPLSF